MLVVLKMWSMLANFFSRERGVRAQLQVPYEANDYAGSQLLLNDMERKPAPASTVEIIRRKRLVPTANNVAAVIRLVSSLVSPGKKASLLYLLASLHTPYNLSGRNLEIEAVLRDMIYSRDETVARAAFRSYRRFLNSSNLIDVLDYGLIRGLLPEDEYSMDLALQFPHMPVGDQRKAAERLIKLDHHHGAIAIAISLGESASCDGATTLLPELAQVLSPFVARHEQRVAVSSTGSAFLSSALGYATWLDAMGLLSDASGDCGYDEMVLRKLTREDTGGYATLAYFTFVPSSRLSAHGRDLSTFRIVAKRGLHLVEQFPEMEWMAKKARCNLYPSKKISLALRAIFRSRGSKRSKDPS